MLRPTIIAGHETVPEQVAVKGFRTRVILLVPTVITWTADKTMLTVRLSHTDKIMQARNKLGSVSVTVHPLPVHLHHIIKYIKKSFQSIYIMNREMTTVTSAHGD